MIIRVPLDGREHFVHTPVKTPFSFRRSTGTPLPYSGIVNLSGRHPQMIKVNSLMVFGFYQSFLDKQFRTFKACVSGSDV